MARKKQDRTLQTMAAQERNAERLFTLENVVGVGTGYRVRDGERTDEVCVQVFVRCKMPLEQLPPTDVVPEQVPGWEGEGMYATDVIPLIVDAQQDTTRYRPVRPGCSIGPEASVSAGTLGGYACDDRDDTVVLLTNNHVISNLDTLPALRRVVQPGRLDGGVLPGDVIGQLRRHVQLNTVPNVAGANPPPTPVDAAIGTIDVRRDNDLLDLDVPVIYEVQAPALGMNVQKRGRTTRLTTNGRVTTINATLDVTYRNRTRLGRIQNSFVVASTDGNPFSRPGDSGSLILNQAEGRVSGTLPVVGLLFAGGTQSGTPVTIGNDINAVFGALDLSTLCVCVARAILRAVFGGEEVTEVEEMRRSALGGRERQLRQLREEIRELGKSGEALEDMITVEAARVGELLHRDEDAFEDLVAALRPLLRKRSRSQMLKAPLEADVMGHLLQFSKRVSEKGPDLEERFGAISDLLSELEGSTIEDILRTAEHARQLGKPGS